MTQRLAYTLKEFAQAVGVAENTARKWAKDGMPTYRVGGLVLVYVKDFEVWLRQYQATPLAELVNDLDEEAHRRVSEQLGRR